MNARVRKYIESAKDARRQLYDRLHQYVLKSYPEVALSISYGIVRYKAEHGAVWLGYWKEGVSIHGVDAKAYRLAHPDIKVGRGSINFRLRDTIDERLVKKIIRRAMERRP